MHCIESVATKMVFDVYLYSFLSFLWIVLNLFPLEMVLMLLLALLCSALFMFCADLFCAKVALMPSDVLCSIHIAFTSFSPNGLLINVQKTDFPPFYELH